MRAAYYGGTLTGSGQSLGLLEYRGTDLSDLSAYFSNVGQTNNVPIVLYSTDGTSTSCVYSQNCDDLEQTIDMTQAIGMAPGLSRLVMYVGSTDAAILNAMASGYNGQLDYQLSSSWTWVPSQPDVNDQTFEEFQAQGQSFFQAAGDDGTWTTSLWNDGYVYPADDPYITSVGGTDLETSSAGGPWSSETTWTRTGGGISPAPAEFPIPVWQTTAAQGCTNCSQTYRNGPDVSANANWSFYVCADQISCTANVWGGTSFAAPMWAGFAALANQQSVADGIGTIGFINPSIYGIAQGANYDGDFHDVTVDCNNAYCATTGFDLVTGLGSPSGQNLINALIEQAATPYESNVNVTLNGIPPTSINYAITFQDATPGSTIHYQVTICNSPYGWSTTTPGSIVNFYNPCPSTTPYGTMYATAPGYLQSSSISMSF